MPEASESATVGEMSTTVGGRSAKVGEIEHGLRNLEWRLSFIILHRLPLRIHGITCKKPIRI